MSNRNDSAPSDRLNHKVTEWCCTTCSGPFGATVAEYAEALAQLATCPKDKPTWPREIGRKKVRDQAPDIVAATPMLDAALAYARRGWHVFPLRPRDKVPLIGKAEGGRGFHDATTDEQKIREWWSRCPDANIGIATGEKSGVDVLDADERHGGPASVEALQARHGEIPRGPASRTGAGYHGLLAHTPGAGCSSNRLGHGIDVRADGGYIVAPPSVHPNGKVYSWLAGRSPEDVPLPPAPAWLAELLLAPPALAASGAGPAEVKLSDDLRKVALDELPAAVSDRTKMLIVQGRDPDDPNRLPTRSEWQWGITCQLVRDGCDDDTIGAILLDPDYGVSATVRDKRNPKEYAARQIAKARDHAERELFLSPASPFVSARMFLNRQHVRSGERVLWNYNGEFYGWGGTRYAALEKDGLNKQLYQFLNGAKVWDADPTKIHPFNPTKRKVEDVLHALRAEAHLSKDIRPPAWLDDASDPPAAEIIACKNGLLHLPSGRLLPHSPTFFGVNALDFDYDPSAPEPTEWLRFLATIWGDDAETIATLQEIFGYCLTTDTRQQKAFLLVGPKRSGKGTIARVLTRLVGQANVCSPTLKGLGETFGLQPLLDKQLAIISDARLGGSVDPQAIAEHLLAITGEDDRTVNRKHTTAWTGRLKVRFVVLSNELPQIADASGALAGRFVVLRMTESFYGKEDLGLENRLVAELPGMLRWTIEGWRRLNERGYFVQPSSAAEAVAMLQDLGSPIGAFLREKCDVGPGYAVTVDALYHSWCDWCERQGRDRPGTKQRFGRDLQSVVPGVKRTTPGSGNERTPTYEGLRLKELAQREDGEIGDWRAYAPTRGTFLARITDYGRLRA